jgi:hypothetical protein
MSAVACKRRAISIRYGGPVRFRKKASETYSQTVSLRSSGKSDRAWRNSFEVPKAPLPEAVAKNRLASVFEVVTKWKSPSAT